MTIAKVGETFLITTDNWFHAPDGEQYRAVFGTLKGIRSSEEVLGIKTNSKSTNWYVEIGNMILAGCQVHYACRTNSVSMEPPGHEMTHEGKSFVEPHSITRIYDADSEDTSQ